MSKHIKANTRCGETILEMMRHVENGNSARFKDAILPYSKHNRQHDTDVAPASFLHTESDEEAYDNQDVMQRLGGEQKYLSVYNRLFGKVSMRRPNWVPLLLDPLLADSAGRLPYSLAVVANGIANMSLYEGSHVNRKVNRTLKPLMDGHKGRKPIGNIRSKMQISAHTALLGGNATVLELCVGWCSPLELLDDVLDGRIDISGVAYTDGAHLYDKHMSKLLTPGEIKKLVEDGNLERHIYVRLHRKIEMQNRHNHVELAKKAPPGLR